MESDAVGLRQTSAAVETEPTALNPRRADADTLPDNALQRPEIYRGTGRLARTAPSPSLIDLPGGQVTLNFAGADIREVIDVVLGDTLNVNYAVDPMIEGNVTVRTSQPIPRSAVIPALENVLALNQAALTFSNGLYKVVPLQEAGLTSTIVQPSQQHLGRGFGINIIPLKYVSASALSNVLESFVSPGRTLLVDEDRNLLIFAGTGVEARELAAMIDIFDVDWMAGMSFGLFPVEYADAETLVAELQEVFAQDDNLALAGMVKFLPIERLNAVLVMSQQVAYLDRAQTWIERLDRGSEGAGRRIFVYPIENARAADLADILGQVFDVTTSEEDAVERASVAPELTAVEISSPVEETEGDTATTTSTSSATSTSRSSQSDAGYGTTGLVSESGDIRIIADERNNSLVILATPGEYRMIEATLERLDIIPLQVLIEATIVEVSLNDDLQYGLEWFFSSGNNAVTFSSLATGAIASAFPGFSYAFAGGDAQAVLNLLTSVTELKVISSPQIMVLDNQSARLQVGDEVPIATQSSVSVTDPEAPIVNSIEFRDTGVILDVTPRVNAGGLVEMEVSQEVSTVTETTSSDIDSPTIQTRNIETTVAVQSGDTIALGGLIQDDRSEGYTGVPLLSSIPILGNLFKTQSEATTRRELLVLITPRVVTNQQEARDVTEELRRRLKSLSGLESKIY
jgi:general secretion pathway protein D